MIFNIISHLFLASRPKAIPKGANMKVSNQKGLAIWKTTLGIQARTHAAKHTKDNVLNLLFFMLPPLTYFLTLMLFLSFSFHHYANTHQNKYSDYRKDSHITTVIKTERNNKYYSEY